MEECDGGRGRVFLSFQKPVHAHTRVPKRVTTPPRRTWTSIDWKRAGARQGWKCALCGNTVDETAELDHVVPLSEGGSDDSPSNSQLLCCRCHRAKSQDEERGRIRRARSELEKRRSVEVESSARQSVTLGEALQNVMRGGGSGIDFSAYVCTDCLVRHRRPLSAAVYQQHPVTRPTSSPQSPARPLSPPPPPLPPPPSSSPHSRASP